MKSSTQPRLTARLLKNAVKCFFILKALDSITKVCYNVFIKAGKGTHCLGNSVFGLNKSPETPK